MTKYKPLTQPKICAQCSGRTIKDAYHVICQSCAQQKQVCAKCLQANEIFEEYSPKSFFLKKN